MSDLRALAEKATPGPWRAGDLAATEDGIFAEAITASEDEDGIEGHLVAWCHSEWRDAADAAYIAAASPDVILRILDERDAAIQRAVRLAELAEDAVRGAAQVGMFFPALEAELGMEDGLSHIAETTAKAVPRFGMQTLEGSEPPR